jgi:hypothetical protein
MRLLIASLIIIFACGAAFSQSGFNINLGKSRKQIRQFDKESVKLDLIITVCSIEIQDTTFMLEIYNRTTNDLKRMMVSNRFILYLEYDMDFDMTISYKNAGKKTIHVATGACFENWHIMSSINLDHSDKDSIIGGFRYNEKLQTFEQYRNSQTMNYD